MRLSPSLCRLVKLIGSKPLALLTFLAVLLLVYSVRAQQSGSEHWVGTWSTAEVGRPQTPPPPAPALPPFQTNQCAPAPPAAPLFVHFNNQTLRQIVHVSIGGSRVRVALSNAYGTAPERQRSAEEARRKTDEDNRKRIEEERKRVEQEAEQRRAERQPSTRQSAVEQPEGKLEAGTVFRDRLKDGSQGPEMVVIPAGTLEEALGMKFEKNKGEHFF